MTPGPVAADPGGRGPLRVVFVLTTPDAVGGTERATFQLTAELARHPDLEVSVLGVFRERDEPHFASEVRVPVHTLIDARPGRARTPDDPNERSRYVDPRWERSLGAESDRAVAAAVNGDGSGGAGDGRPPDVLVATTPALLALLVQVAHPSTAVIAVEHRASATRGATGEPLRLFGPRADALVSLTADGTDWFARTLGADAPELRTIPNPLPAGFAPRASLREPLVLAAGRMVGSKQFGHAVRAFAIARRPGWRLRVIGDGPERRRIERTVRTEGVHDHVELVPFVPDLGAELAKSSLLVMSSRAEGLPLVALEALEAGVPIVSYDCPVGPRAIVEHDVSGLLVPPNDVDALAEAIASVIDDDGLRRRLGAGAIARRDRFAPAAVGAQWRTLLHDVASRPTRRSSAVGGFDPLVEPAVVPGVGSGVEPWVPRGGLLLHVGPHKTGTTAVQSAFAAARERLADLGITYPGRTPAPHGAVMNRLGTNRGWDDAIAPGSLDGWEQLCIETRTAAGTVVVSSEAFCHADDEQAAAVCEQLRPGPARVVITLRALVHVIPSSWQEYVKSGWTLTFGEFLRAVLMEPDRSDNPVPTFWQRQDHGRLVERWCRAVGPDRVCVVVADPSDPAHLVRSFERLLGIEEGVLSPTAGASNRSLTAPEVELLRRVNLAVRDDVPWERFNRVFRQGATVRLVEDRRPPAGESRVTMPQWAVDVALELGASAMERIVATGVRVEGDLARLVPDVRSSARADAGTVDPDDHAGALDVPVDAVATLLHGLVDKRDVLIAERERRAARTSTPRR